MLRGALTRLACPTSSLANRAVATQAESGGERGERQRGRQRKFNKTPGALGAGAGLLLAAVGVKLSAEERIKAVEKGAVLDIEKEDKIRQYHPIDSLFDYFSSYQLIDNKGRKIQNICDILKINIDLKLSIFRKEDYTDERTKLLQRHDPWKLHWSRLR